MTAGRDPGPREILAELGSAEPEVRRRAALEAAQTLCHLGSAALGELVTADFEAAPGLAARSWQLVENMADELPSPG